MPHSMTRMVVAVTLATSLVAPAIHAQDSTKPQNTPGSMMAPGMIDQDNMMQMMNQMSQMMENCSKMMQAKADNRPKDQPGKPLEEPSQSPGQPG